MPSPTKSPTPAEYAVIALVVAGLLIIFGAIGLTTGLLAVPEKAETSAALTKLGAASLGLGLFVAVAYWVIRRWGS